MLAAARHPARQRTRALIVALLVNAATANYANSWAGRLHAGVTHPNPPPSPPRASPPPPPPPDAWGATLCPPGWNSAPNTTKCMRLLPDPETHAHCEHACAAHGGSLACIQTPAEDGLAATLTFTKFGSMIQSVWTGEYQYPPEPSIRFALETPNRSAAYTGQPHWGTCSNGQNTSFSGAAAGPLQFDNFNGAEDCMSRSMLGYYDESCATARPCLCEWGVATSPTYRDEVGPALASRAEDARESLFNTWWATHIVAAVLGSLPAVFTVLYIELCIVRAGWLTSCAGPEVSPPQMLTPTEKKLRDSIHLSLRRRMLQAGLSLWVGGVLVALSLPAQQMFANGAWPAFGCCDVPFGWPINWAMLRYPGILIFLLSIRPSDSGAIRMVSLGWLVLVAAQWGLAITYPPFWVVPGNRNFGVNLIIGIFRGIGLLGALICAVPEDPNAAWLFQQVAQPARLALRMLWWCIRLETILFGLEFFIDSVPYMNLPVPELVAEVGTPMVVAGAVVVVWGLVLAEPVRRFLQGMLGDVYDALGVGIVGHQDSSAATVIQTMVTGDAVAAVRDAYARLYTIKMSKLTKEDMRNNQDSGLFHKTEKAATHDLDAFLSHSWRDDKTMKWTRMLEYKAEFEAANGGREPRCWLDKACIDQSGDIDASLQALPIFLLSSRFFVVFVGDSYLKRMWCVLELFSFIKGGGSLERIVLKPLKDGAKADQLIATLDISAASCYLPEDRQRITAIVESSYGTSRQFNQSCRKILLEARRREKLKAWAGRAKKAAVVHDGDWYNELGRMGDAPADDTVGIAIDERASALPPYREPTRRPSLIEADAGKAATAEKEFLAEMRSSSPGVDEADESIQSI